MAKMIPAFGPIDNDSYGEKTVYALLKEGLSDDFTVIHSLPWLSSAARHLGMKLPPSGEIDFLVLHRIYGVLAFEVKSGIYRVDGPIFVHLKTNNNVDVVKQTRNNVHGLARWLGGATTLRLRIGYGFIFPDSYFDNKVINTAMVDASVKPVRKIFVDKSQLPEIAKYTIDIMQYWKSALGNADLGSKQFQLIIKTICPQFDGTPDWGTRIIYDHQLWLRLTHEQIKVIELLSEYQRFVVTGWPGTGKTLIGIEFARRFVKEQKKVLFITFNNRLSEYIRQQTPDSLCDVFTWHKLCHQARNRLSLPPESPTGWFESGCCEDLLSALNKNKLKDYDVLIIDEAQALHSSWLKTLSHWFENKRIIAFCDETQTFSFEKGTNHIDLQRIISSQFSFSLTIVLRCPKAVTDYLMAIRPSSYQITSPRNNEPDTLKELVVIDPLATLLNEILRLKASSVPSDEITVLVPTDLVKSFLQKDIKTFDINIETVSRFRGMESPVVITLDSSNMEDAQLFCAYSRATTAFIAIYDSEKLAWSEDLSSWFIEFDAENSPAETWVDYLYSHYTWPILYWSVNSRRVVYYITNQQFELNTLDAGTNLSIKNCAICEKMTPFDSEDNCLLCNKKTEESPPTRHEINEIREFDLTISQDNFNSAIQKEKRQLLPIPLAAASARRVAFEKSYRNKVLSESLPGGKLLYRSALAFIQAWVALLPPDKTLVLDEITDALRKRYIHLEQLDRSELRNALACALSTCYNKKHLIKVEKGKYSPIDD
ncbi:AAA family ATPase [Salmonella enterica subsp. salamae]|nr:AAA family ATPase [Salmonella enterica subsp. enterica]ECJ5889178.1 AAA family ATPase [Salmonella enterica subsp. salamae]